MYNKYLEIFIQVADTGSFSKAADKTLYVINCCHETK